MNRPHHSVLYRARKGSSSCKTTVPDEILHAMGAAPGDTLEWKKLAADYVVRLIKKEPEEGQEAPQEAQTGP